MWPKLYERMVARMLHITHSSSVVSIALMWLLNVGAWSPLHVCMRSSAVNHMGRCGLQLFMSVVRRPWIDLASSYKSMIAHMHAPQGWDSCVCGCGRQLLRHPCMSML